MRRKGEKPKPEHKQLLQSKTKHGKATLARRTTGDLSRDIHLWTDLMLIPAISLNDLLVGFRKEYDISVTLIEFFTR